jgi:alcohol dehydrogenase (NADP+)
VLLDILYCAICHSDIHHVYDDWGTQVYPTVPGHEIIGRVVAVGNAVTKFKMGDIGGVGTLVDSCRTCVNCAADQEHICVNGPTITFDSPDRVSGGRTFGGFSEKVVIKEHFVMRIPPGMDLPSAAPLLCAGITTFSPMQHWKVGRGQRVGIVGIGGLGHIAVKLAAARGANVTMFTTTPHKTADAERLGARNAVLSTDETAMRRVAGQFDILIVTIPRPYSVGPYLRVLKYDGTLINLGALEDLQNVDGRALAGGRKSVAGSLIGALPKRSRSLITALHTISSPTSNGSTFRTSIRLSRACAPRTCAIALSST